MTVILFDKVAASTATKTFKSVKKYKYQSDTKVSKVRNIFFQVGFNLSLKKTKIYVQIFDLICN